VFGKLSRNMKKAKYTKEKIFNLFDLDRDSKISKDEMRKVLSDMKMIYTQEDLDLIFQTLDRRRSGSINLNEFVSWLEL
jgi:Ca2+-binding EF-hand superfamily protein